jgi:uncharacterized coiled-coil DUF342 family protein
MIERDWSMLEASQQSLREHMLEIARQRVDLKIAVGEVARLENDRDTLRTENARLRAERDTLRELVREIMQRWTAPRDWRERAEKALSSASDPTSNSV